MFLSAINNFPNLVCRGYFADLNLVKQVSLWLYNECRLEVFNEKLTPTSSAADTPPSSCKDEKHKKEQIRGEWWINFIS